ncbi:MAG: DUF1236 domain-containing protein [Xanthobacteraceae bacterium]
MRGDLLRASVLALAFAGGGTVAVAQQPAPPADTTQQQQQRHDDAQHSPSGQAGKEEPGSHAPTEKPQQTAVLVNGALAVPGAPANSDTVPAKFSAQNAADDKLSTLAYTFKTLSEEQRRAIYEGLKNQPPGAAFNAEVGVVLPPAVELRAMPDDIARRVPQTGDYRYAVADNRVLLVSPLSRAVVGIFLDAGGAGTSEGRR